LERDGDFLFHAISNFVRGCNVEGGAQEYREYAYQFLLEHREDFEHIYVSDRFGELPS